MSKEGLKPGSKTSVAQKEQVEVKEEIDNSQTPDFIYGGPFIKVPKSEPFFETATPINIQLQGTFKQSFAYHSLKERMPVILTKVIDQLAKKGGAQEVIARLSKLKSELATNKKYAPLTVGTEEAQKWNKWIDNLDNQHYFNNTWLFTECYIYRRLREAIELDKNLQNYDPFQEQKEKSFVDNIETMCVVAEQLPNLLGVKENWVTMLKLSLWSNKCDLSLSLGAPKPLTVDAPPPAPKKGKAAAAAVAPVAADPDGPPPLLDPFKMIDQLKNNVIVDESKKINLEALQKKPPGEIGVNMPPPPRYDAKGKLIKEKKPPKPPPPPPLPEGAPPPPDKQPCPAKVVVMGTPTLDIVCDNAGYEMFADLCLADFVLSMNWVQRVRFHVKKIPWFISDVTAEDFKYTINACMNANYNRTLPEEPKIVDPKAPPPAEGAPPAPPPGPRVVTSEALRQLGAKWKQYCDDNKFLVMSDDFWTSPHVFKDMAKHNYNLYRKLQMCVAIVFKGDLNYRKLVGDRNCNPVEKFPIALQGFNPAPIIALRTVKAELICGMKKGKFEVQTKKDPNWMLSGNYGVIQYCKKKDKLKVATKPCLDYEVECINQVCPTHTDLW